MSQSVSQVSLLAQDTELVLRAGKLAADSHVLPAPTPHHERYLIVVGDLWDKQIAHSRGIALLLGNGFYDSALVVARGMYETAINLVYLMSIGNKLDNAAQYVARQVAELARTHGKETEAHKAVLAFPSELAARIKKDMEKQRLWSGKYLGAMAGDIGVKGHSKMYAFLCMAVHARGAGLNIKRESQLDGSTKLIYGPPRQPKDVESLANLTRRFLRRS